MPRNSANLYSSPLILLIQALGYIGALVFSLVVCVPMAINQEHFKGHCLLFSTGVWQERDGQFKVDWASQAYCNFTIFVAVFALAVSLGFGIRIASYVRNKTDASFFAAFCEVIANGFVCLMTLIAAIFVTFGFRTWCSEMTRRFQTCWMAAGNPIDKADGIDSSQFYFHLTAAQFGIWGCLISTFTTLVFSTVKLCRYHHQENLRVSMAKERRRLINEDALSDVPTRNRAGRSTEEPGTSNEPHFVVVQGEEESPADIEGIAAAPAPVEEETEEGPASASEDGKAKRGFFKFR